MVTGADIPSRPQTRSDASPPSVRQAWRDLRSLNLSDARRSLAAAEHALMSGGSQAAREEYGDLFAVHAMTLVLEDDTLNAAAAADQALRCRASGSFAAMATLVLRFCAWKAGAAPPPGGGSTVRALHAAGARRASRPGDVLADVLDLTLAAAIEFSRLRVATSERLARCALHRAERAPLVCVAPAAVLGRILYAQGRVGEAEQTLRPRLALLRRAGSLDCAGDAYGILAAAAAHAGDMATAWCLLDEAGALARARNWPRLEAAVLAERVRLCGPDDAGSAALWIAQLRGLMDRHPAPVRCARSEIANHLRRAEIHAFLKFRIGPLPRAALAWLRHDAWLSEDRHALMSVKLADARCLWAAGEPDRALGGLVEVIAHANATGLGQHLLDAGPPLRPLLDRLIGDGGLDHGQLAFAVCLRNDIDRLTPPAPARRRVRESCCGEKLSLRERDVLKLIGEGRTNKTIARMQGVAPETIKTQVKNIFIKLGVQRRAQAVAKAGQLGLI